jgi:hypothetical protein
MSRVYCVQSLSVQGLSVTDWIGVEKRKCMKEENGKISKKRD